MADSSLSVSGSAGTQAPTTQNNLQANGQNDLSNGLSGKVQPVVNGDQLRSDQGIALTPTALPSIQLGSVTAATPIAQPAKHHFNPYLMIFSILLLVAAIVMFKITNDSGKKHNQY